MLVRIALVLFLILHVPSPVHALQCFVISGLKHDWNGAFESDKLLQQKTSKVAGKTCKILGSWKDLLQEQKRGAIHKNENVFVYQGAHGGPGGNACNNDGEEPASKILEAMEIVSKTNKLSTVIRSCYSGDLLMKQIAKSPQNPNLCLVTSSVFGQTSSGDVCEVNWSTINSNTNMNRLYSKHCKGFSSAAQWSASGVTRMIRNERTDVDSVVDNMNKVVKSTLVASQSCYEGVSTAMLVLDCPRLDFDFIKNLIKHSVVSGISFKNDYLIGFLSNQKKTVSDENLKTCIGEIVNGIVKDEKATKSKTTSISALNWFVSDCKNSGVQTQIWNYFPPSVGRAHKIYEDTKKSYDAEMPLLTRDPTTRRGECNDTLLRNLLLNPETYQPVVDAVIKEIYSAENGKAEKVVDLNYADYIDTDFFAETLRPNISTEISVVGYLEQFSKGSLRFKPKNPEDIARFNACENFKFQ